MPTGKEVRYTAKKAVQKGRRKERRGGFGRSDRPG